MKVETAMILAAGLGTRMRPLTEQVPKPLVKVGGKCLLQYCLDAVKAAGLAKVVVNVHHLPQQIIHYLAGQNNSEIDIRISDEREQLLDSGGGIVKALPELGTSPFLVLNSDTFWFEDKDQPQSNISMLIDFYDSEKMDILLMLAALSQTTGHDGGGDFTVDEKSRLTRAHGTGPDAVIYAGAAILHPRIFKDITDKKFSLNRCFDVSIRKNRLYGHKMHGHWISVGTIRAISEAEAMIKNMDSKYLA